MGRNKPAPDMSSCLREEAAFAIELLEQQGYEAYLVGGCVRDCLMGKIPEDIDIATSALPQETKEVFKAKGLSVVETGIRHGTVTVLVGKIPLEITTYRVDGTYTDHRRPDRVAFTARIQEDLARRDFTINAMAWSPKRGFADEFSGREDLEAGILRCVGDGKKRLNEDALRIMRALRFAARYGFAIEGETEKALFSEKRLLREVSAERIFSEWKKLLAGRGAAGILIRYVDILAEVFPELLPMKDFAQNNPHHRYDVWTHSVMALDSLRAVGAEWQQESGEDPLDGSRGDALRLAAILHDVGKPSCYTEDEAGVGHFYKHGTVGTEMAENLLLRMKADGFTRERVLTLIRYHDTGIGEDERGLKRWLRRLGPQVFMDLLLLKRADNMAQNRPRFDRQPHYRKIQSLAQEMLRRGECFALKDLAVTGKDLLEEGIPQGPEMGRVLNLLLSAVIDGEAENEKISLLTFLNRNICGGCRIH